MKKVVMSIMNIKQINFFTFFFLLSLSILIGACIFHQCPFFRLIELIEINNLEYQALCMFEHMALGVFIVSIAIVSKFRFPLLIVLIVAVIWELYEGLFLYYPFDTLSDIVVALLAAYIMNEKFGKNSSIQQ